MGRLIDANDLLTVTDIRADGTEFTYVSYGTIEEAPTVEAIPKADYENRLKADMVAMLTDIQLEIEEKDADLRYCGHNLMAVDCIDIIQQKIDALKGNTDGSNTN